jgi:hypothetical protein
METKEEKKEGKKKEESQPLLNQQEFKYTRHPGR